MNQASSSSTIPKSIFKVPKGPQTKRVSRILPYGLNLPRLLAADAARRPTHIDGHSGFDMPIELVIEILNFVQHDKETMRTCCIVCRSWLPCARSFLLPSAYTLTERNARALFTLLAAPNATLGAYISVLTIHTGQVAVVLDRSLSFSLDVLAAERWMCPALDAPACLRLLVPSTARTLRALTLRDIGSLSRTDPAALVPVLRALPALARLELAHCLFPTLAALFDVVCARPTLQRLVLTNILVADADADPEPIRLPRRLAHLALQTTHQSDILLWLLAQPAVPALASVSLGGIGQTDGDLEITSRFLAALGPHLAHLKLYLTYWTGAVTLRHNTNLRSLSVSRYSLVGERGADAHGVVFENLPGLLDLLGQLAAPQLAQISLRLINNPEDLESIPWNLIDRLLREPQFRALQTVRIRCFGESELTESLAWKAFPSLYRRGILRFHCDLDSDRGSEVA